MSQNSNTQPNKSILKRRAGNAAAQPSPQAPGTSKTTEIIKCPPQEPSPSQSNMRAKFDEANIRETYHPANKDYGFMKIEEPKTPYNGYMDPDEAKCEDQTRSSLDGSPNDLDAGLLSKLLSEKGHELPKSVANLAGQDQKREFESQRKAHYTEFQATKLAKQLIKQDEDDEPSQTGQNPRTEKSKESGSTPQSK